MKQAVVLVGLLGLAGAGAWLFLRQRTNKNAKAAKGNQPNATISLAVADVNKLPNVAFNPTELDLEHLEKDSSWRYHGTVIV